jgi:hypothetical protein
MVKKYLCILMGFTADIIPDMVDLGLDAINAQLFLMDIEALGARFSEKLLFGAKLTGNTFFHLPIRKLRNRLLYELKMLYGEKVGASPNVNSARAQDQKVYGQFLKPGRIFSTRMRIEHFQ